MTKFWLGTTCISWLRLTDIPLFIGRRCLSRYKREPVALGEWALDSGGYYELKMFGRWTVTPKQYIREVRRWIYRPGNLAWAAAQDWMCDPGTLAKTGLTVREHQRRTTYNYLELIALAPELPWVPVIQGFRLDEYIQHAQDYEDAGVSLSSLPIVGIGSIATRQGTSEVERIIRHFARQGIKIHGFGVKTLGLMRVSDVLESADSQAYKIGAMRQPPFSPDCTHAQCTNCLPYAINWYNQVIEAIKRGSRYQHPDAYP